MDRGVQVSSCAQCALFAVVTAAMVLAIPPPALASAINLVASTHTSTGSHLASRVKGISISPRTLPQLQQSILNSRAVSAANSKRLLHTQRSSSGSSSSSGSGSTQPIATAETRFAAVNNTAKASVHTGTLAQMFGPEMGVFQKYSGQEHHIAQQTEAEADIEPPPAAAPTFSPEDWRGPIGTYLQQAHIIDMVGGETDVYLN